MPHGRGGMKPDLCAGVEQPPAHIDIVAGGGVYGVKAGDVLEYRLSERHVATRDVLGAVVGEQHMHRAPGGAGHDLTSKRIVNGWKVGTADTANVRRVKTKGEVPRPLRRRIRVGIEVRDQLTARRLEPDVA